MLVGAIVLGGCRGFGEDRDSVTDRSAGALTVASLLSANGSYGPACTNHSGSWSVAIASGAGLAHPVLSVVENDEACELTLDSLVADDTYVAVPALALGAAYQASPAAFSAGGPIAFYASAKLSPTFASDFTLSILLSSDPGGGAAFVTAERTIAPDLGTARTFAVFGAEAVTSTGFSFVTGDLGSEAVTGFPPGIVDSGVIHVADAASDQAKLDTNAAYLSLGGLPCDNILSGQDLGGLTLTPGVHCYGAAAQLTGTLTLDALGDPGAVFVIRTGTTVITAASAAVDMVNGADPCNVYWQVGSSATIGANASFMGNIVALTSITLSAGVSVVGRALACNGGVTMDTNAVSAASCQAGS
jgi:hypothetical protein